MMSQVYRYQRKSADGKRHASIPAFIRNPAKSNMVDTLWGLEEFVDEETKGKVRRQCTGTYKIDVVEKTIREEILALSKGERWPTEPVVRQWIGISTDEAKRMRRPLRDAFEFWYPLVHHLKSPKKRGLFATGFTRQDCLDWMAAQGMPTPPRSACIGCPFHSDVEWALMKLTEPQAFEDACKVDELIRESESARLSEKRPGELIGKPYLHSSLIPLRMVEFDINHDLSEGRGMLNECSGMCGV